MEVRHYRPPDPVAGYKRDPNFVYRFCDKTRAGRLQVLQNQGWEIVHGAGEVDRKDGGTSMDQGTHYRGLILLRMPRPMGEERDQHFKDIALKRQRAVEALLKLSEKSDKINRDAGEKMTSAFSRLLIKKGNTIMLSDEFDSAARKGDIDVDPDTIKELLDVLNSQKVEIDKLRGHLDNLSHNLGANGGKGGRRRPMTRSEKKVLDKGETNQV